MCVLDLDQTALHFRQALNFIAHIAYRWDNWVTDSSKQFFVLLFALSIVFSGVGSFFLYVDSRLWFTWWTGWNSDFAMFGWSVNTREVFFRAAQECGEFSATSAWTKEIFTAPSMMFGQEVVILMGLVVNQNLGEATRPGGDGAHQGQASV